MCHANQSPTPTPVPRQRGCHSSPESSTTSTASTVVSFRSHRNNKNNKKIKNRYPVEGDDEDDDEGVVGDRMECSGKYCKSCSAGMIADCVALCCCPCAVLNLLTLAFVKLPWMVGRKCLRLYKNKNKENNRSQGHNSDSKKSGKKNKKKGNNGSRGSGNRHQRWEEEEEMPAQISWYAISFDEEEEEEEEDCVSSAERVWLELYQLGHLGFGRVSFTGSSNVQSVVVQCKSSLGT